MNNLTLIKKLLNLITLARPCLWLRPHPRQQFHTISSTKFIKQKLKLTLITVQVHIVEILY
jgi:uncharacterized protein with von Willebrand factor type A (vWA) domain